MSPLPRRLRTRLVGVGSAPAGNSSIAKPGAQDRGVEVDQPSRSGVQHDLGRHFVAVRVDIPGCTLAEELAWSRVHHRAALSRGQREHPATEVLPTDPAAAQRHPQAEVCDVEDTAVGFVQVGMEVAGTLWRYGTSAKIAGAVVWLRRRQHGGTAWGNVTNTRTSTSGGFSFRVTQGTP